MCCSVLAQRREQPFKLFAVQTTQLTGLGLRQVVRHGAKLHPQGVGRPLLFSGQVGAFRLQPGRCRHGLRTRRL